MKKIPLNALSVAVANDCLYTLVKQNGGLSLLILDKNLKVIDEVWSTRGYIGFILKVKGNKVLVSIDNKLCLVEDNSKVETVLKTNAGNTFWHLAESNGRVFVHEYGKPPTGIYMSTDLRNWEKIITNTDIDKSSKHFHYIAYDSYRKWLVSTLGDGCLTRVAISEDLGSSWRPLYRGPWQFVPILILKDKLVFGMDSGIARGGVAVYRPEEDRWSFIFLRWEGSKFAQMSELIYSGGLYIAALGSPQAIVVAKDLRLWYPLHIERYGRDFNRYMSVREGEGLVAGSTGSSLVLLRREEVVAEGKPIMRPYTALLDRVKGTFFTLKRAPELFVNVYRRSDRSRPR